MTDLTELEGLDLTGAPTIEGLQSQLRAEQDTNLLLRESMADLQLQLEDRGWQRLAAGVTDEFTPAGRKAMAALCRVMAVSNPLMKRGLNVRIGYIWGQGVEIRAGEVEGEGQSGQDVNAVVQAWLDTNRPSLSGSQAQEELERALGTDGNVYLACFTDPLVGRVQVRSTPADEIVDIVTNPEDRDEPWFYVREYVERKIEAGTQPGSTRVRGEKRKVAHPALSYRPATRIRTLNGAEVRWDAPILHVPVNRLDGWLYGIPDLYASMSWARLYREFLVDWAGLTKALSKIAWRATGNTRSRAQQAAAGIQAAPDAAGGVAVSGPGQSLEAVPKSGATIDSQSGKPLAAMVAAGLDLPVTVLLADPGVTGARAVAETLDLPTVLAMGMRRLLWQSAFEQIARYVVEQAVVAPRGGLRGTVRIDPWGRRQVQLAGDTDGEAATIEIDWPPIADVDPVQLVQAIASASDTGVLPPLTTLRLLLSALGVKDIDEVLASVTDEQGRFVDPGIAAAADAIEARRRRRG